MATHPSQELMQKAIEEAKTSASQGQYAVGALVVCPEKGPLALSHTSTHADNDPSAHAEMNAIRAACAAKGSRYLEGCWLYTTLEPCPMCCAAAVWAKMEGIVFGATQYDASWAARNTEGGNYTWRRIGLTAQEVIAKSDPSPKLIEEFMRPECEKLLELNRNR
jgi:tRNA(Arg) A34 adenosine deaminase TadA